MTCGVFSRVLGFNREVNMETYRLKLVRDGVDRWGIPERCVLRVSSQTFNTHLAASQECDYRNYDLDDHIYWVVSRIQ